MQYYAKNVLPNPLFQAIAFGIFLAYTGVAIYGSTRLQEGLPLSELSPDSHYLKKYILRSDETFGQDQNNIAHLYFRHVD